MCTTGFTDNWFSHEENSPHRSLTHRRFCAQHFLHTIVFTRRCFYTDTHTHIAHRNLCTQRVYTQPTFAQRGFASRPTSLAPCVPALKFFFCLFGNGLNHTDLPCWSYLELFPFTPQLRIFHVNRRFDQIEFQVKKLVCASC